MDTKRAVSGEIVTPKVAAGWQTWVGYGSAVGSFAVALALDPATGLNLPDNVQLALVVIGGALAALTGKNRSDQARELVRAQTTAAVISAPIMPAEPAGLPVGVGSGDVLNVELDGMPSEIHPEGAAPVRDAGAYGGP